MRGFAYGFYSLTIRSCLAAGLAIGAAMFAAPGTAHAELRKACSARDRQRTL